MSFAFYSRIVTSGSSNQRNRRKSSDKEQRPPVFAYARTNVSVDRFRASGSHGSPQANRSADRDSTGSAIRRKIPFLGRRRKSIAVLRPTEEPPMYDKRFVATRAHLIARAQYAFSTTGKHFYLYQTPHEKGKQTLGVVRTSRTP